MTVIDWARLLRCTGTRGTRRWFRGERGEALTQRAWP